MRCRWIAHPVQVAWLVFPVLLPSLLHSSVYDSRIVLPALQPLAIGDHGEVCQLAVFHALWVLGVGVLHLT